MSLPAKILGCMAVILLLYVRLRIDVALIRALGSEACRLQAVPASWHRWRLGWLFRAVHAPGVFLRCHIIWPLWARPSHDAVIRQVRQVEPDMVVPPSDAQDNNTPFAAKRRWAAARLFIATTFSAAAVAISGIALAICGALSRSSFTLGDTSWELKLGVISAVGVGVAGITFSLARRYFEVAKEVADIVLGFTALLLCVPVLIVCALIIKLSGHGPVLFRQVRVGKNGRLFTMYKFRTMTISAETASGAVWAGRGDFRVLPACRWMRMSHVDELPQLINVVKGEMSMVGPRPERPEILTELEKKYPKVRERLAVRPGITGLAQVRSGYDTSIDAFRLKLEADLEYIERRNWSTELEVLRAALRKPRGRLAP
jgi:lipopolysaccharide/colanic/teichoic acid biosynthesis glycosyltransferase